MLRFVDELVASFKRVGATGPLTVRVGLGFWLRKLIGRFDAHSVKWSITVTLGSVVRAVV